MRDEGNHLMISHTILPTAVILSLAMASSATAGECDGPGDRRALDGHYEAARREYEAVASLPRCASQRAHLLLKAAIAAETNAQDGTESDRCAVVAAFERVIAADPTPEELSRARRGLEGANRSCPPPPRAPAIKRLDDMAESAPQTSAPQTSAPQILLPQSSKPEQVELRQSGSPSASRLITDALPAEATSPGLTGTLVAEPWDADDVLLGAATSSAAGAGLAYVVLLVSDAQRSDAQRDADRALDRRELVTAVDRYDGADHRATISGITAYSLLGVSASLFTWWGIRQITGAADEGELSASSPSRRGMGSSRR
ncbi:MAG: hypothetical protein H6701_16565 [Myxococcales bacterium]|nr:hypothetical protein [Myxococcales bacterium]